MPPSAGAHVEINWTRLYRPTPSVSVSYSGASPNRRVFWDRDTDRTNNTAGVNSWGALTTTSGSGSGTLSFPVSRFQPGTYRLFVEGSTGYSPPITVRARHEGRLVHGSA